MVCGEICRRLRVGGSPGFTELLGMNDEPDGAQRNVLGIVDELAEESGQALDAGMQFSLLLPDEAESIGERTGALADWARGFVLALLRGDGLRIDDLEADSAEVVRDLFKISEAQPGGDDEEDERALMELEEYLRVGVQLVFEELQPQSQEHSDKGIH